MIKENIFGRSGYIELLEKRIKDVKDGYRQNIAVIGDELVGKSSIIFELLDRTYDSRLLMLYLESRPESTESFCRRFIGVLLYSFLSNSSISLKEDLDFLINKSETYIPKTVIKIKAILSSVKRGKKNNLFEEVLSLTDLMYQETGKSCVVIFDEFQNLENIGLRNIYKDWSKLLISQKHSLYIIVSSAPAKARGILSNNLSLLFGNFQIVNVEPFDNKTAEEYLRIKFSSLKVNKGMVDFIINFTGGYPFYLNVISEAWIKSSDSDFTDILEGMLFCPSGILNQRFTNYLKRFQDKPKWQEYLTILYLIASGNNKVADIAHVFHKQKNEIISRIEYLTSIDVLKRSGDFLIISDRVFSFWLKFVYQSKNSSLTFDAKNQKNIFRDKIEQMINEFLSVSSRSVADRLVELLHLFGDNTINIEKRKVRLNQLREVKLLEFAGRPLKNAIIGRSSDAIWIMGLKNDSLTEEDVADFAKECKKYRHKTQKKVIVALHEIDSNAKLRALEEKIMTLDVNALNQIFDVFCRPRVIA